MSEMAMVHGRESKSLSKVQRYGWTLKDEQGNLKLLHKNVLQVHPAYQRHAVESKIKLIASTWSWVACGAIIVGERNGEYWVIDGQHRVVAARRRADIDSMPCIVFETASVEQEARGFLNANTGRKPVSSLDKFRASIAAGDKTAKYIDTIFNKLGIIPSSTAHKAMEIKSVAWAMLRAQENPEAFEAVISLAADLCQECILQEILLEGLYYIQQKSTTNLNDTRMRDRLKKIGAAKLVEAAKRASAYYTKGGAKIWADGMLSEINKGLRNKFDIGA